MDIISYPAFAEVYSVNDIIKGRVGLMYDQLIQIWIQVLIRAEK